MIPKDRYRWSLDDLDFDRPVRKDIDGDGDGWVDDGKPTMRPAIPKAVKNVARKVRDISIIRGDIQRERKAVLSELDKQGVAKDAPIRHIFASPMGNHVLVVRDSSGKVIGGVQFRHDKRDKQVVVTDMRMTDRKSGHGSAALQRIAQYAVDNKATLKITNSVGVAKPFYIRNGAIFQTGSGNGEWTSERRDALAAGKPIPGGDLEWQEWFNTLNPEYAFDPPVYESDSEQMANLEVPLARARARRSVAVGSRITPRQPKKTDQTEITMRLDTLSPDNVQAQVDRLVKVGAVPPGVTTLDEVLAFMESNIQSVLDTVSAEDRDAWGRWYEAANQMGQEMAAENGITNDAAYGIIASLSPGAHWDINMSMAHSLVRTLAADPPASADVAGAANALLQAKYFRELEAYNARIAKARKKLDDATTALERTTSDKDARQFLKKIAQAQQVLGTPPPVQPDLQTFKPGVRPSELSEYEAGFLVRAFDPNPVVKVNKVVVIDGETDYDDSEIALTVKGNPIKGAWQSYENIAKAIAVYRDPTPETISRSMGNAHKVRTFFNNISDPFNPLNDATIDTHSAGISVGLPLTISHPFIQSGSQSIMSAPSHIEDGTVGTYALMAEAHRRVAEKNGLLPRELQSITWEAWRRMHTKEDRKQSTVANRKSS